MKDNLYTEILILSISLTTARALFAEAGERAKVPADGKIVMTDYGYRDWGPELVHFTVDTNRFQPGQWVVRDFQGQMVPAQIEGPTLSFVAGLSKGGSSSYQLHRRTSTEESVSSNLSHRIEGDRLEIGNEHLAVRMPAPGRKNYPSPVDAASVPTPILQWANPSQGWMGSARFHTPRKVRAHTFSVVRQGPAVIEYEARYEFAPQGEYVWRLRLSPGMPLAIVTEEFDLGDITRGEDMLVLELHRGWQPKSIGWVPGAGEQQLPQLQRADFLTYVEGKKSAPPVEAPVGGVGKQPSPNSPGQGFTYLESITPGNRQGSCKGGVQVWNGSGPEAGQNMAVVSLSSGSWRRAMALDVWHQADAGLALALPISVRPLRWSLEVTDDFSPFSTHEHDSGLKPSYGRRVWGLYVGPGLERAQGQFGHIGLDRYKDWIVELPEGPAAKGAYPGALFRAELVERLKKSIDQHPQADWLKQRYLISGKTEDAVKNAEEVIHRLQNPYQENDFFILGLANYRKTQLLMFANRAEDALACPELPSALRQELRRRLTLYAYVTSDPDWNPRGVGVHLGNNNMPINRTLALVLFAPLLPDHPRYTYWMDKIHEFLAFKFQTQTAPDGVDIECPTYHTYAPAQAMNLAINALNNRGIDVRDLREYYRRKLIWLANLTMPDPRYQGNRIIPGMGNSGNIMESIWGSSLATFADDPEFAGWLKYIFELSGKRFGQESTGVTSVGHAMYYLPDVPTNPTPLTTSFMPTYGVAFRNHFGTPNEVAMLFRAGMNWGHWDTDALNTILYGKGAPLTPGTWYQYYSGPANQGNAIYHNQVKVGTRNTQECFGRVDATVTDYGFGPNADYAVASRFHPSQIFHDQKGPMNWNRHILFLKSARLDGDDYFVLRETFTGDVRPTWWEWMNLDTADLISVDGATFDPAKTPNEKVVPENEFPSLRGQIVEMKTKHGASTWFWFSEVRDVRTRLTFKAANETKTIVVIPGRAGQDCFYAAYPRKDGEPIPACSSPIPGVMRIKTPESADTVFIGDTPFDYRQEEIVFSGKAGAVRVFADRVALCLNAGSGQVGYHGYVLEGHGPFERVVPLADLKPGVYRVEGGYDKKKQVVELPNNIKVTGEGPFVATLEGQTIRIKASGRARVLHVTQPPFITTPQYTIDGQEWMACWTDYPSNGWGTYDNTWLIGLSVPEGSHELIVKERMYPAAWTRPFTPLIQGVLIAK